MMINLYMYSTCTLSPLLYYLHIPLGLSRLFLPTPSTRTILGRALVKVTHNLSPISVSIFLCQLLVFLFLLFTDHLEVGTHRWWHAYCYISRPHIEQASHTCMYIHTHVHVVWCPTKYWLDKSSLRRLLWNSLPEYPCLSNYSYSTFTILLVIQHTLHQAEYTHTFQMLTSFSPV